MASEGHHQQLDVFLFPLMAYGHMIPIVDIARLLAAGGANSTIITTFCNTSVLNKIIERDQKSGLDIGIKELRFPAAEVGIPEGSDIDSIDSPELLEKLFTALNLLQEPLEKFLEEHRPDFIVADVFLPWVTDVASKFGIPRLVFHGISFFSLCVSEILTVHEPYKKIPAEQESFILHGLPDQIEIKMSQLPEHVESDDPFTQVMSQLRDSELKSYGVIVNSFYELEPAYAEHYRKVMGRKAWHIGPVSLRNRDTVDKAQRGKTASIDEHYILNWLDSKNPNSVLYICFGGDSQINSAQLLEIAIGLENSEVSFVWVIRKSKKKAEEESYLPEGFEEGIKGKGLIIRGWAPQVLILDHQAIGGFMTHCGWNSTLESISAGVPMITWPLCSEQFHNEKLVTQVLKIGIQVGAEQYTDSDSGFVDKKAAVKKEKVEEAVNQLMGDGKEANEMRRKASKFKEMAKRAVEEGGSSFKDLTALIEELRILRQTSTPKQESG